MNKSTYYELPIYEPNDSASLIDGYNKSVIKLDVLLHQMETRIRSLELKVKTLEVKNGA